MVNLAFTKFPTHENCRLQFTLYYSACVHTRILHQSLLGVRHAGIEVGAHGSYDQLHNQVTTSTTKFLKTKSNTPENYPLYSTSGYTARSGLPNKVYTPFTVASFPIVDQRLLPTTEHSLLSETA